MTTRVRYLGSPGNYETVDVLDSDGRPYSISRCSWNGPLNSAAQQWVVFDSRLRVVSSHATLADAKGSL